MRFFGGGAGWSNGVNGFTGGGPLGGGRLAGSTRLGLCREADVVTPDMGL